MREQTIKSMVDKGVPSERAAKIWDAFQARCNGGDPVTIGDVAVLKDETIREKLADNHTGAEHLILALRGPRPAEDKKPEPLKEKHRETLATDVLLTAYLKGNAAPWIADELQRVRGKGKECLFLNKATGAVYEEQSAWWIEARRKGMPLGEGLEIEGKLHRPVMLGAEKPAQKHLRDPFAPDLAPLTMPKYMSVCGASLETDGKPIGEDEIRFLVLVGQRESGGTAEQRRACETAKQGLTALLAVYPLAKRAWDDGARPEATVSAEQWRGGLEASRPTAAGTGNSSVVGSDPLDIHVMLQAILACGLERGALMSGIDRRFVASLPDASDKPTQTISDLARLRVTLTDGSNPLRDYLKNAVVLAGPRIERAVFQAALDAFEARYGGPAWLSKKSIDWTDRDLQKFARACADAYPKPDDARHVCRAAGLSTGGINFEAAPRYVWNDALDYAWRTGKLRDLYNKVRSDPQVSAYFAEWT